MSGKEKKDAVGSAEQARVAAVEVEIKQPQNRIERILNQQKPACCGDYMRDGESGELVEV